MINDFKHEDGDALLEFGWGAARGLGVCDRSARGTIPILDANDTRGRWDGDARGSVADVCANGRAGQRVAEIAPRAGDAFVFKPRHSAFDRIQLQILLEELEIERLRAVPEPSACSGVPAHARTSPDWDGRDARFAALSRAMFA